MPDHLELQVSCLAGGTVLQVHSLEEARAAEAWGAVAIFFSDLDVLSDSDLHQLIEEVSLHPVCMPGDFPRLNAAYKERTPHHFSRVSAISWRNLSRALADAASPAEVKSVFDQGAHRPNLIICKDISVLPAALKEREKIGAPTLLFVESGTVNNGATALRDGANGVLLTRANGQSMPTKEDQRILMNAVIEASVGEWPQRTRVIGVMSHQGDYLAHLAAFEAAIESRAAKDVVTVKKIRTKAQYDICDAVVLPGGWSNLQTLYLAETGLDKALRATKNKGLPVLGTCAGMILCGSNRGIYTKGRVMLGLIPGTIDNNVVDGLTTVKRASGDQSEEILFSNGPVLRDFGNGIRVLAETYGAAQVVGAQHGSTFVFSYHDYERTHPEFLDYCLTRWSE